MRISFMIATAALLGLASCSHPQTVAAYSTTAHTHPTEDANAIWYRMFCDGSESYRQCEARMNQQAGLDTTGASEMPYRRGVQFRTDDSYCRTQAQLAMAAADHGGLVYGGIMAMAYGNQTYRVCQGME